MGTAAAAAAAEEEEGYGDVVNGRLYIYVEEDDDEEGDEDEEAAAAAGGGAGIDRAKDKVGLGLGFRNVFWLGIGLLGLFLRFWLKLRFRCGFCFEPCCLELGCEWGLL